jgi:rod shape-determining protein MreC
MERNPPPLFRQGVPAFLRMLLFALIAIAMLVADSRLQALGTVRHVINAMLYPLQRAALLPRDAINTTSEYFSSLTSMQKEIKELHLERISNAQTLQQSQILALENSHLRKMLDIREKIEAKSVVAQILYDARDVFTRKIVLNRGAQDGVERGQPVIDENGVVGQVTRVFPMTAEVTLLTDKDQAIPVQVLRNGLRTVVYGRGQSGLLDMRFLSANADIQVDDVVITSGIDGVYPAGLSVAKVTQIESLVPGAFGRVVCQPIAGMDRNRHLLILLVDMNIQPRPDSDDATEKAGRKRQRPAQPNK